MNGNIDVIILDIRPEQSHSGWPARNLRQGGCGPYYPASLFMMRAVLEAIMYLLVLLCFLYSKSPSYARFRVTNTMAGSSSILALGRVIQ